MNRYFIARNRDRLVLPSSTDLDKYGKAQNRDENDVYDPYQEKSDLCVRIVKKRNKGLPEKSMILQAVKLMHLPMEQLKRMYDA